MNTKIKEWERKFFIKLKPRHKQNTKKVFHKLMKKSSTLRSSLKRRSKEYEVNFKISLDEIRNLFLGCYGRKCRYCTNKLDIYNIVCDHVYPISMGGSSDVKNLQMICGRCNTRKGNLTNKEFQDLLRWLSKQTETLKVYVLRKLAKGDIFR